jgi:hypothetical protein
LKKPFTIPITLLIIILSSVSVSVNVRYALAENTTNVQLSITGLVANPLNLSRAELDAMPKSAVNAAIICVDFPGHVVAQGNWVGVKLRTLLEAAQPLAEAVKVAFYAADGYSTDLRLDAVMRDDIIVAYEKDGEALNALRLVVPGKWGYKWINQLSRIELVDYDFLGFWESRGYSDDAEISSSEPGIGEPLLPNSVPSYPPLTATPTAEPLPSSSYVNSTVPLQPSPSSSSSSSSGVPAEAGYAVAVAIAAIVLAMALFKHRNRL